MSDELDTLKKLIEQQQELMTVRQDHAERVPLAPETVVEDEELEPIPLGELDQNE